ncbi:MAG: sulfotransferase [Bacteroidota bacterium]
MNTEKVIFIGGSGRSGTTLMAQLLDYHSEVASIFEVPTLISLLNHLRKGLQPSQDFLEKEFIELGHALLPATEYNWRMLKKEVEYGWRKKIIEPLQSGDALISCVRNWLDYMHQLQMVRDGSKIIIHKTPVLVRYLPEIKKLFPESQFIHMLRDPRHVIASYKKQTWGPTNIEEGIKWYCERVSDGFKDSAEFSNYMEIKLEELLSNPDKILSAIQSEIGVKDETKAILDSGLIDFKRINHRAKEVSDSESKKILSEIGKSIPRILELYSTDN